jgi:hypothetical protein
MSQSINGDPDPTFNANILNFRKYTTIRDPVPSKLIAFLNVHADEILDTEFGIPWQGYWGTERFGGTCRPTGTKRGATLPLPRAMLSVGSGKCRRP